VINTKHRQKHRSQNQQEEISDGYGSLEPKRIQKREREPSPTETDTLPVPLPTAHQLSHFTIDDCPMDSDYAGVTLFVLSSPQLSAEERKDEEIARGICGPFGFQSYSE
jgi:hypothetical protein